VNAGDAWVALSRWYDAVGPGVATITLLRLIAVALGGWLVVAATLQVVGALVPPLGRARALVDLISPRSLQRLGHGLAGLSLTAGLAAPAPGAGIPARGIVAGAEVSVDEHRPGGDRRPTPPAAPTDPKGHGTATMRLVDGAPSLPAGDATPATSTEVTVVAGDSFWSIAVSELTDVHGGPPTDRQVVPYWRQLIDVNRPRLVDPGNPDLLFPGQVLTVPPP
jgi:nucleoid-associated protein YgaU